jgi:hypothetical protein
MADIDSKTRLVLPIGAVAAVFAGLFAAMGWLDSRIEDQVTAKLNADLAMQVLDLHGKVDRHEALLNKITTTNLVVVQPPPTSGETD